MYLLLHVVEYIYDDMSTWWVNHLYVITCIYTYPPALMYSTCEPLIRCRVRWYHFSVSYGECSSVISWFLSWNLSFWVYVFQLTKLVLVFIGK